MLWVMRKGLMTILSFLLMLYGIADGNVNFKDFTHLYFENIAKIEMFENTPETALPQTEVYNIVKNHLEDKTGDKVKKAIIIGYDGCRVDALNYIDPENSAIMDAYSMGGTAVLSYCGGKNYPAMNTQDCSTAPGWCSILTGVWADVHGVTDSDIEKSNEHLTLLTTEVLNQTIDSAAFYISWNGHFSRPGMTYYAEKQYVEQNGINVKFVQSDDDDEGTLKLTLDDIKQADCSDFIFLTIESTDHIGHTKGFCPNNVLYREAFAKSEMYGKSIIDAIKARPTYDAEDWLIVVTTDHGGYNNDHGHHTAQERTTFIVTNKPFDYELPSGTGC